MHRNKLFFGYTGKRGQIEMIGLAIVVIILAIGLIFYFKFGILRKEDKTQQRDPTLEIAYINNLMGAVFNIEVCNGNYKLDEVLVMCLDDSSSGINTEFCDGLGSCDYVNGQIKKILDDVGLGNYKKYSIWVEKGLNSVNITDECETGILGHTIIVTASREHYTANFRLC